MWISFPITRGVRVILPWPIAVVLLPVAVGLWGLALTVDAMRWGWRTFGPRRRQRNSTSGATVKITIRDA